MSGVSFGLVPQRILAAALMLAALAVAGAVGLAADEYHAHDVVPSGWTGMTELDVASTDIDTLFDDRARLQGMLDFEAALARADFDFAETTWPVPWITVACWVPLGSGK